jgi:hypothetical protein
VAQHEIEIADVLADAHAIDIHARAGEAQDVVAERSFPAAAQALVDLDPARIAREQARHRRMLVADIGVGAGPQVGIGVERPGVVVLVEAVRAQYFKADRTGVEVVAYGGGLVGPARQVAMVGPARRQAGRPAVLRGRDGVRVERTGRHRGQCACHATGLGTERPGLFVFGACFRQAVRVAVGARARHPRRRVLRAQGGQLGVGANGFVGLVAPAVHIAQRGPDVGVGGRRSGGGLQVRFRFGPAVHARIDDAAPEQHVDIAGRALQQGRVLGHCQFALAIVGQVARLLVLLVKTCARRGGRSDDGVLGRERCLDEH